MLGLFKAVPITVENMANARSGDYYELVITRPFLLQNPYKINADRDRSTVLRLHRQYVLDDIRKRKSKIRKELDRLVTLIENGEQVRLLCHCKPKACHGDLYVKLIKMRLTGATWQDIGEKA